MTEKLMHLAYILWSNGKLTLKEPQKRTIPKLQYYRVFSHDVTAAILVSQNNETAAMLVSQTNPLGAVLFSYSNAFFCSNKFAGHVSENTLDTLLVSLGAILNF